MTCAFGVWFIVCSGYLLYVWMLLVIVRSLGWCVVWALSSLFVIVLECVWGSRRGCAVFGAGSASVI